ncbi:hypothetical protein [Lysobacter sp. CA199]|uniref:hypothetical protein n=1 Tax=Lysobacter sp. CA199 TaxID=3455608 RepID=UPI003F8D3DD2
MKTGHITGRRHPAKSRRFSWARVPGPGDSEFTRFTTWRLYRRDVTRRLHNCQLLIGHGWPRQRIAAELRRVRNEFRDAVDALDFKHLGLTP